MKLEKGKIDIAQISSIFVMLVSLLLYSRYNIVISSVLAAASVVLYYFYRNDTIEEESKIKYLYIILFWATAVAILLHVVGMPSDFFSEEWNEIIEYYRKISGDKSFFEKTSYGGSSTTFLSGGVIALLLLVVKSNVFVLKVIPVTAFVITLILLFLTGKRIENEKLGLSLAFVYALSSLSLFTSKILMPVVYLPMLVMIIIFSLFNYVQSVKRRNIFWMMAAFFVGFLIDISWVVMIPFLAYFLYEYRKDFTKAELNVLVMSFVLSIIGAATIYIINKDILAYALAQSIFSQKDIAVALITGLKNIPLFFMFPIKKSTWFLDFMPLMTFTELVILFGGIVLCVKKFKEKHNRVMLVGFIISLFTLVISTGIKEHINFLIIIPFVSMLSGFALYKILKWKYANILIITHILLFLNISFFHFVKWEQQTEINTTDKAVAAYINREYKNKSYLFIHETRFSGLYPAYLRTKGAYSKNTNADTVIIVSTEFMKPYVKKVTGNFKMQRFTDTKNPEKFTVVLYEINVSDSEELKKYFFVLQGVLKEINLYLWDNKLEVAYSVADDNLERGYQDNKDRFKNTIIRFYQLDLLNRMQKITEAPARFGISNVSFFETADWYYYMGKIAVLRGENFQAKNYFLKAIKAAPNWKAPKRAFFKAK